MASRTTTRLAVVALVALVAACDSGDSADAPPTTAADDPTGSVTTTTQPARDSEFCREMRDLDERITGSDDDEELAAALRDVAETYARLDPIAPFEVSDELVLVRERLEREAAGDALVEAELAAADAAAEQIAVWVAANCAGVINNPGPPATAPP